MAKQFPVKNSKTTFGMHLMLDAYKVPKKPLDHMKLIYKFLFELPGVIGMTKLMNPMVVDADLSVKTDKDPGGISGFVMINESHVAVHTFPDKGFLTMDVYSCNNFESEVDKLMKYTKKTFPFKQHELQVVKRGLEFPM